MGSDEAQQSLLSESRDHSLLNEKSDLQRRRPHRGSTSDTEINLQDKNVVQNPSHLQSISATKLEAEFHFKPVFLCLAAYLGAGTLCFYFTSYQMKGIKTNRFLDAIYFCVVTMTTVGYGDLVPNSSFAKLLACIYVFTGMALVGLLLSKAADYIVEKQEVLLVRAINKGRKLGLAELSQEVENHRAKYKFMVAAATFIVLMIVGIIFLYFVENLDFVDAFYCVCATITTLGYGDESFSTTIGRTFAVFWILSSTICLAQFFAYLAELYAEGRQKSLAKMVLTRKLSPSDLEAADLDGDRVISRVHCIQVEGNGKDQPRRYLRYDGEL
ncbi:PREDICTED: two-pore potassium channel 1-like isoform X2 [Lupinus angustifolius]|uniref:two-pore potassium channel 1-like isoform X2 n=1 Tax=Lupinus angustifolius TaxID=3871 RepID=UPI00092F3D94|nr:PREDICTED: two-pore potassium channel 1-like isoform X2 [Lupinus angustifolius]